MLAHVATPMRPIYTILYCYPHRFSLIKKLQFLSWYQQPRAFFFTLSHPGATMATGQRAAAGSHGQPVSSSSSLLLLSVPLPPYLILRADHELPAPIRNPQARQRRRRPDCGRARRGCTGGCRARSRRRGHRGSRGARVPGHAHRGSGRRGCLRPGRRRRGWPRDAPGGTRPGPDLHPVRPEACLPWARGSWLRLLCPEGWLERLVLYPEGFLARVARSRPWLPCPRRPWARVICSRQRLLGPELPSLLRPRPRPAPTSLLVYCDNVSAVYLSTNLVQHQRTKHVEIDLHFVCDRVAIGDVRVLHVPTTSQFADIFTKGLPSSTFTEFRSSLNITSS